MNIEKLYTRIIDRFWEKVDKNGPYHNNLHSKCWLWKASTRQRTGYGNSWDGYKKEMAHRLSYRIKYGPIPEGKLVLHKCDNKLCVNPDHLYLGTDSDNARDKVLRYSGNLGGGSKKGRSFHCPGILNQTEIQRIKELWSTKKYTQQFLGIVFGCNGATISNVLNNKGAYNYGK